MFEAARRLIPFRAGVVCAVSGGPDSVAMTHALIRINEIHQCEWRIAIAHFDHQLRADSAADAEFVRELAQEWNVRFVTTSQNVRAAAEETGTSIETAAREERYAFLCRAAKTCSAGYVSLAHHADDQAETVLHRILRGTGLRGLAGMPEQRNLTSDGDTVLVRPMLGLRKQDILAYCDDSKLPFRVDATNDDPNAATRNRIRQELIPLIERVINPKVGAALVQLAQQADQAAKALRAQAEAALNKFGSQTEPDAWTLEVRPIVGLQNALRTELLATVLEKLGVAMQSIGHERIQAANELIDGDGRLRRIELSGQVTIERRGGQLVVRLGSATSNTDATEDRQVRAACR